MSDNISVPSANLDAVRKNIASVSHAEKDVTITDAEPADADSHDEGARKTSSGENQTVDSIQPREVPSDITRDIDKNETAAPVYIVSVRPTTRRFTVGAYTTGGLNSNFSHSSAGDTHVSSVGPAETEWNDNPKLGILLYNQGKEIRTDIHHRQPLRAALSFGYRLNQRLSLATGLTYTNLTSDIRDGSESHYITGEQVLHYRASTLRAL